MADMKTRSCSTNAGNEKSSAFSIKENEWSREWNIKAIKTLSNQLNDISAENKKLRSELDQVIEEKDDLADAIYELEVNLYQLAQYGRRENLQIQGIPNTVKQNDLQRFVLNILDKIGVKVPENDVVGCHRLFQKDKKKPADTIIRFLHRDMVIKACTNFYKIRGMQDGMLQNIRFVDNLCPYYKKILAECGRLKRENKLSSYWSFNGIIHVKLNEKDNYGEPIYHMDELYGHTDASFYEKNSSDSEKNVNLKNIKSVKI